MPRMLIGASVLLRAYAVMMEEIRLGIARAEQQGKGKGDGER